jgi:hypothetical protein
VNHDVTIPVSFLHELDEICHFASPASPVDSGRMPIPILDVDALGTRNVLDLARMSGTRILLARQSRFTETLSFILSRRNTGETSTPSAFRTFAKGPSATPSP